MLWKLLLPPRRGKSCVSGSHPAGIYKQKMAHLIIRVGELFLKGRNRPVFVRKLMENIALAVPGAKPRRMGQFLLLTIQDEVLDDILSRLARVFGISSLSVARLVPAELEAICAMTVRLASEHRASSFRITAKRQDKRFPLSSPELERAVGDAVREATGMVVNLANPGIELSVDILEHGSPEGAALYAGRIPGAGGLPSGIEGVAALVPSGSDDRDFLAGWLALKRGCELVVCAEKKPLWFKRLKDWAPGLRLSGDFTALLAEHRAKALVLGASAEDYPDMARDIPVLCPLVGLSDEEVRAWVRSLAGEH